MLTVRTIVGDRPIVMADLILQEIFGTTYPYCLVDLDDQGRRTASVQSASINPSWQEELSFPVSVQQWILSNLRIQVRELLASFCLWWRRRRGGFEGGGRVGLDTLFLLPFPVVSCLCSLSMEAEYYALRLQRRILFDLFFRSALISLR